MFLGPALISLKSKKQHYWSHPLNQSIIWLHGLLVELGFPKMLPHLFMMTTLDHRVDANMVLHECTKNIEVGCHYIWEILNAHLFLFMSHPNFSLQSSFPRLYPTSVSWSATSFWRRQQRILTLFCFRIHVVYIIYLSNIEYQLSCFWFIN